MNRVMTTAIVTLLAGGVAVGAYKSGLITPYADVVSSTPVTIKEPIYGDVVSSTPVTQTVNSSERVCENRTVQKRRERFGTKDGTIIGAVVGGLVGNQFGGGSGRALATVGGAAAGGLVGHEVDERHQGGRVYTTSERVCRSEPTTEQKVIGYDIRYRAADGQILTRREEDNPGKQLWLGDRDVIVGYDVNWRYKDQTGTIRMGEKPGDRLPMRNGAIVVANQESTPNKG